MASVVLRSVGAAVGNYFFPGAGGAILGAVGGSLSAALDAQLGLGTKVQGPRLENMAVQDSRYGAGIPLIYGRARVAGNVIWATDLIETQHTSNFSGGKGGGSSVSSTTYSYSLHCAAGIAAGAIGGITTIWADSKIIYQDGVWTAGVVDGATIYLGGASQGVDAFMESILGSGNVPAYRGLAYVVFENLQLANFGNRLPNLTFEIAPVASTNNPELLDNVDALVSQRPNTVKNNLMPPLVLENGGGGVRTVLQGGYKNPGASGIFQAVEWDVSDVLPVELARTSSGTFTSGSTPADQSWALAPDGRYVAMYNQSTSSPTHNFCIYDTETRSFGTVLGVNLTNSITIKQLAWIDAQHFVIDDISGTTKGLRVFARAGLDVIDLGFFNVWGSGSSSTRVPYWGAQFTPFAGGLMVYAADLSTPLHITLYARPVVWQNNALVVGSASTLVSGLTLPTGSGPNAMFLRVSESEWVFFAGGALQYAMFSFVPGVAGASITRSWQVFTPSFGAGSTNFPMFFGDRILILQQDLGSNYYRLSEVVLDASGFTLSIDGAISSGNIALTQEFLGLKLDSSRILLTGCGLTYNLKQLAVLKRCDLGDTLSAIVGDLLTRAGYSGGDYDVSALAGVSVDGYVLQDPTTARAAIEPLQLLSPFDLVESGDELKAVPRSAAAAVVLPASEWRAANDGQDVPPPLSVIRSQELDLPLEITVDYVDPARDFEINSQRARRLVTRAKSVQKIPLPIVCAATTAKQIAEARLFSLWAERDLARLRISRKYLTLDPGDVVDLDDGRLLRIARIQQAGGLMEAEGFFVTQAAQSSSAVADGGQVSHQTGVTPISSTLYLLDLPLLQADDDQPGVYAAATGLAGWTGAGLWRASDGVNFNNVANLTSAAIAGVATSVLADRPALYMDRVSTVNVQVVQGTLSSCSEADLLNGANAAVVGSEILQFQTATLVGPGLYTLSHLLRGRRGTEWATSTHVLGENFVLLTVGTVDFVPALLTDRGAGYDFRALTRGQSLSDAQDHDFTYNLLTLQPFAPVNVAGVRASGTGSDLTISWQRRARLNAEWIDHVDVPLDEPNELYDLEIMNGGSVMRTFSSVTSPNQVYTAAQQVSDWGSPPASYDVRVYQISSRYGRGRAVTATI